MIAEGRSRTPRALTVLGALLGESPEAAVLRQAVRPPAQFRSVEDRLRVFAAIREHEPDVVVFAAQDHERLPTAPLIGQCARERPGTRILLLCLAPPPRGNTLLAAARSGARVLVAPTSHELEALLARISRSLTSEVAFDCDMFAAVQPLPLRDLLCAAARTVVDGGRVSAFARHLHVSTRTLSRQTRQASLVSPRAMLSAVRLIWACALMESARRDIGSVARATGFVDSGAMLAARRRYFVPRHGDAAGVSLPACRDALPCVVEALGGRVSA